MTQEAVTMLSARDREDNKGAPSLGVAVPERTQVTALLRGANTSLGTPKAAQRTDI